MDGIIIINKPKGYTSHDVVNKIRKIYNTKKVGHTGTLDPNATGVLPILIGKATKLSQILVEHDKTYIATIKLGEKTNTADSEGEVIEVRDTNVPQKEDVEKVLKTFLGTQLQTPPIYSSIKIDGKKLYEYAREGKKVQIPKREITVYNIELKNIVGLEIEFLVSCSKGTYIRSLCEDIAEKLGTIGYMKELTRVQVDKFNIRDSYTLEEVEKNKDTIKIISIEEILRNNEKIILNKEKLNLFLNGGRINIKKIMNHENIDRDIQDYTENNLIVRVYNEQNDFIGTGIINNNILKRDIVI